MGTNVTDAITHETIYEGNAVIAILISAAQPKSLGHFSTSSHKISSFPMEGFWDGSRVIPHDDMSFSSNFNQILVQSGHGNQKSIPSTFIEIQDKLARDPVINGETYSLMVIRESTVDLLKSLKGMDFKMGNVSAESDIANCHALAAEYVRVYDLHQEGDNSEGIKRHMIKLEKALDFSSIETHINGIEVPAVGSALIRDSHCVFSDRLIEMVEEVYGYEGNGVGDYLKNYRELPRDYDEIITKLHQGQFIAKALDVIGRQVAPSMTTIARQDDHYNLEMASKIAQRELQSKLAFAKEASSPGFLADIDKEIESMKRMLADVIRQRKEVGRELGIRPGLEPHQ
jgi:hypothetical protein